MVQFKKYLPLSKVLSQNPQVRHTSKRKIYCSTSVKYHSIPPVYASKIFKNVLHHQRTRYINSDADEISSAPTCCSIRSRNPTIYSGHYPRHTIIHFFAGGMFGIVERWNVSHVDEKTNSLQGNVQRKRRKLGKTCFTKIPLEFLRVCVYICCTFIVHVCVWVGGVITHTWNVEWNVKNLV